jgi:hypothetical protein
VECVLCVVLCAVFCLSVVSYLCDVCYLCVVSYCSTLSSGKIPFAVKINNNNNSIQLKKQYNFLGISYTDFVYGRPMLSNRYPLCSSRR